LKRSGPKWDKTSRKATQHPLECTYPICNPSRPYNDPHAFIHISISVSTHIRYAWALLHASARPVSALSRPQLSTYCPCSRACSQSSRSLSSTTTSPLLPELFQCALSPPPPRLRIGCTGSRIGKLILTVTRRHWPGSYSCSTPLECSTSHCHWFVWGNTPFPGGPPQFW
jgi:hypothetical protein